MWRTGNLSYYIRMENIFRKEVKTIMSGITSIVVGILMFFIFGVGYIVGKCVAYDEKNKSITHRLDL